MFKITVPGALNSRQLYNIFYELKKIPTNFKFLYISNLFFHKFCSLNSEKRALNMSENSPKKYIARATVYVAKTKLTFRISS
jgi:hypothetical protein